MIDALHLDDSCAPIHYTAFFTAAANKCEKTNRLADGTINNKYEFVFAANQTQNETFMFKDAMQELDSLDFIRAMLHEIAAHEKNNHWNMIPRTS